MSEQKSVLAELDSETIDRVLNPDKHRTKLIQDLRAENARLRKALAQISDTVDDALLLDEELALAWGDLRDAVIKARAALGGGR